MRFENILAKKYILAQKRHSMFTICSIVAAVALMTMIFCAFTTFNTIRRESIFDKKPYHILITPATEKQAEELRDIDGVESVELVKTGNTTEARVMFRKYLKDYDGVSEKVMKSVGLFSEVDVNNSLISLDLVSDDAKYELAQTISLMSIFTIIVAMILRLMIDTAFEVSSKERERQFGLLQSIGATPKQIVRIITFEGCMLSVVGVPIGVGVGVLMAYGAYRAVLTSGIADAFFTEAKAEQLVRFHVMPVLLLIPAVIGFGWVLFSAYGTGVRVIKMSPVDAISARSKKVKKVRRHSLYGLLFGWTGKLAARNNRRQPKRFIITVLSLTLSITLFASLGFLTKTVRDSVDVMLTPYDVYGQATSDDFYLLYPIDLEDPASAQKYLDLIEDSGYFKNIRWNERRQAFLPDEGNRNSYVVNYVSRDYYDNIFGGVTEMTYDELTANGGYILLNEDGTENVNAGKTLELEAEKSFLISEEEYTEAEHDKSRKVFNLNETFFTYSEEPDVLYNDEGIEDVEAEVISYQTERVRVPVSYTIVEDMPYSEVFNSRDNGYYSGNNSDIKHLFATYDTFISRDCYYYSEYGDSTYFMCDLVNKNDYNSAMMFLRTNSDSLRMVINNYKYKQVFDTAISAMNIGVTFVSILIAIIAIVNMVNIISTGLLNRRGELAAMQCIGMTRRQLNKLTVIESLQYSLIAGVASTMLCELMIYGTKMFMRSIEGDNTMDKRIISYSEPLPTIWIAAAAVFAVALIASFIAVSRMNKTPLIEQLRTPE